MDKDQNGNICMGQRQLNGDNVGTQGICIGYHAGVPIVNDLSVEDNTITTGSDSICIGYNPTVGNENVSIGRDTKMSCGESIRQMELALLAKRIFPFLVDFDYEDEYLKNVIIAHCGNDAKYRFRLSQNDLLKAMMKSDDLASQCYHILKYFKNLT